MTTHAIPDITKEARWLEGLGSRMRFMGLGFGAICFALAWVIYATVGTIGKIGFYYAYLVSVCYILAIALGSLFFVLIHHATGAGWSVVVRRLAEGVAATIPFIGLLFIPVLRDEGFQAIYHSWSSGSPLVEGKRSYLNQTVFTAQIAGFFVIWSGMAWFYFRGSLAQDRSGDPAISARLRKLSYPAIPVFAVTLSLAAFNLLMALDPEWYSTIFGVYYFASSVMSFFAFLALFAYWLQRNGRLAHAITVEHYHDIGKLCFAFIVFWAYIAFSQYMLIWYANLPEETVFYRPHHNDPTWGMVSWVLILGHFLIPFLFLLSRHVKRNPRLLAAGCAWVLAMHWVDLFWIAMPRIDWAARGGEAPSLFTLALLSGLAVLGALGCLVFFLSLVLGRCSLVPERDPRLAESLAFENF